MLLHKYLRSLSPGATALCTQHLVFSQGVELMTKRKSDSFLLSDQSPRCLKRQKRGNRQNFLDLSNELILQCLSFLDIGDLVRCEGTCQKLYKLVRDDEIWREKYFQQFFQRRTLRIRNRNALNIAAQTSKILRPDTVRRSEYTRYVKTQGDTDWKNKFRMRWNWSCGRARKSEITVASALNPPVLVRIFRGSLYTADPTYGLRIWRHGVVIEACPLVHTTTPTALAVDALERVTSVAVGYSDGTIEIYQTRALGTSLVETYGGSGSATTTIAMTWPYMMILYKSSVIELVSFTKNDCEKIQSTVLTTLQSEAQLSPAALSLRRTQHGLLAGIAYAFNHFNTGWCLGLQEIKMSLSGEVKTNRAASSVGASIRDTFRPAKRPEITCRSAYTEPFALHPHFRRPPNSLSYCGCYVLAGLPDNTLMVYNVISTDDRFEINMGRRLWGHTSGVSAAEVSSTGKALSISAKNDEVRYWELEDILSSHTKFTKTSTVIQDLAKIVQRSNGNVGPATTELKQEEDFVKMGVSFDDEQVVVLGERSQQQVLSCYDFS